MVLITTGHELWQLLRGAQRIYRPDWCNLYWQAHVPCSNMCWSYFINFSHVVQWAWGHITHICGRTTSHLTNVQPTFVSHVGYPVNGRFIIWLPVNRLLQHYQLPFFNFICKIMRWNWIFSHHPNNSTPRKVKGPVYPLHYLLIISFNRHLVSFMLGICRVFWFNRMDPLGSS